ncbi:hypothetical protein FM996_17365 [Methylosinus sporium]|uniref:DUF2971 domain-containing protein n=1 Tax=Methylosinus sporium TaxID=428 RepID=A0A549SL34_METSR|nr:MULTISPECIES: hypothetical protein [Methylosinus]MBU3890518.1 hypothetical protein [Methylosinus sp. KRF6]TRL30340.1 hypothetical protein FM996_17365 [Methylosinus sporium]
MKHFFAPKSGQILYHYTTAEAAEAIIRHRTLRLSEFSMMNDKSEYVYARSKFVEAYQNREVFVEEVPRYMANIKLNTHESATVMMVGCLTEDRDDVGLWERYADRGSGCVLGFDALWLAERAGVAIRRVSYDPEYLREFVNAGLAMLQSHYEENMDDREELAQLAAMFVMDLYAFKDPRFHSEREVRVSRLTLTEKAASYGLRDPGGHRGDGTEIPALPIQLRQGQYGPTRFIDLPLWDDGLRSAIRSVGFGPIADPDKVALVKGTVEENTDITFWTSDVPLR